MAHSRGGGPSVLQKASSNVTLGAYYDAVKSRLDSSNRFNGYLKHLPELYALLSNLVADERVPFSAKALYNAAISYLVTEDDIIPDHDEKEGYLDDMFLCAYCLKENWKIIPVSVMMENAQNLQLPQDWRMLGELVVEIHTEASYHLKGRRQQILHLVGLSHSDNILSIIKKGESTKLEFKETLRKNIHTKQNDHRMEIAVMKTIVAFLNSEGGTLLVGVSDEGEITGVENEKPHSMDKYYLHFINLLKKHVGLGFTGLIKSEFVKVSDKTVLQITCVKSEKYVFLKTQDNEQFYVRTGPSSRELSASEMMAYVKEHFHEL